MQAAQIISFAVGANVLNIGLINKVDMVCNVNRE